MSEGGNSGRNIFSTLVLVAILVVLLIVGYLIVDTLNALRQPITGVSGAVGTQVQQALHPTPTIIADPVTVIKQIQSLSRMETSSFTIEKVITAESGEGTFGFLFSDKLLLVAQGQVIAGIDMARMGEGDVRVVADTVYITMPAAEIFVATLDNDATYVYDRQTGFLAQQQIDLETLARREAENQILIAALEGGILDMAQTNGQNYIQTLMQALGFQEVVFVTATPAPDQDRGRDSTP
jgi:Protein of unknown function (DUF4230)